jgi:hypothetical protein
LFLKKLACSLASPAYLLHNGGDECGALIYNAIGKGDEVLLVISDLHESWSVLATVEQIFHHVANVRAVLHIATRAKKVRISNVLFSRIPQPTNNTKPTF